MIDTPVSQHDDRLGDARPAAQPWTVRELTNLLLLRATHRLSRRWPDVVDLVESSDRLRLPAVPSGNRDDGDLSDGRVTLLTLYRSMAGTHATLEILSPSTRPRADAAGHADREGG
jgi:hypothetical protein